MAPQQQETDVTQVGFSNKPWDAESSFLFQFGVICKVWLPDLVN